MRRLHPDPVGPVNPADVYGDPPQAEGRPGVRLNMIASADGAVTVDGRSGGLGGAGDRALFRTLRSLADVVLVGAGTVRAEGYGPPRGGGHRPRIAVVTRSCHLDWSAPLFAEPTTRPLVVTVAGAPPDRLARAGEVADVIIAGAEGVDLPRALRLLGERGAGSVLCEGGPSLNGGLAAAGLVDELCLTLAPLLVGGDSRRIVAGPALSPPPGLALASVCADEDYLFLRYRRP